MSDTPFQKWRRESPVRSRRVTVGVAISLLAVVAWSAVPTTNPVLDAAGPRHGVLRPNAAASDADPTSGPEGVAPDTTSVQRGGSTGASLRSSPGSENRDTVKAPGAPTCAGTTASAQGVTPTTLTLGVGLLDIANGAGNSQYHIRSDQTDIVRAIVKDINAHGGVDCRTLIVKIYSVDPTNSVDQRRTCDQAATADKVFAFLDGGGVATEANQSCFTETHRLPLMGSIGSSNGSHRRQAPYFSSYNSGTNRDIRNWVFNAAAHGFFDRRKGFDKLGLLVDDCDPDIRPEIHADLARVGVTDADINEQKLICNDLVAPPSQITQAAVEFKQAHVSHVFPATSSINVEFFLEQARQQSFYPVYGASDYLCLTCPGVTNGFDATEWKGTVGYTATRSGDLNAGLPLWPETARCNAVLVAASPPVRGIVSEDDDMARVHCDLFHLFMAAMRNVSLNPTQLDYARAVPLSGRLDFASVGEGLFNRADVFTGGDFQRMVTWFADCTTTATGSEGCWKVTDPVFRPGL